VSTFLKAAIFSNSVIKTLK